MTDEKIKCYKDILHLENLIEIGNLIVKYRNALSDYYQNDVYNIENLWLIIDAFLYFSGFEIKENDCDKLINKGLNLLEKEDEDIGYSESLYMVAMLISSKLLENAEQMEEEQLTRNCKVLYILFATIEAVEKYENSKNEIPKIKGAN